MSTAANGTLQALHLPLKLARISFEKVWGGRALERTPGIQLDLPGPVGETWELVDREDHNSLVAEGPLEGRDLRSLMEEAPEALLGRARPAPGGRFPLLVKFLSASQPLSIQVHPDDDTARRLGAHESGKTECWYILDADPGALIHLGLSPGVDPTEFAAKAGGAGVVDLLRPFPVVKGQFVFVPAGTLHSIGAGVTLVEVQQNSDLTYRLFDWGRAGLDGRPRGIQLAEALLSIRYGDDSGGPFTPALSAREGGNQSAELVDCPHFRVELLALGSHLEQDTGEVALAYVVTAGRGRISIPGSGSAFELAPGDTWLVPAAVGPHRLEARSHVLELLRVETKA